MQIEIKRSSEKGLSMIDTLVVMATVCVGLAFVLNIAYNAKENAARMEVANQRAKASKRKEEIRIRTTAYETAIGYPAGVEQLKNDGVYWVSVAMVDITPTRTNHFAVLQTVAVRASDDYKLSLTNRLFLLPWNLVPGRYYRIFKIGTNNISYDEIPGPLLQ